MLSFLLAVSAWLYALFKFVIPMRHVDDLNFTMWLTRDTSRTDQQFPLRLYIEIRNFTGSILVISSPYIVLHSARASDLADCDAPTGRYELKFRGATGTDLNEALALVRPNQSTRTYLPLHPSHVDDEVVEMSKKRPWWDWRKQRIGTLYCRCTWLGDEPRVCRLARTITNLTMRDIGSVRPM